MDKSMIALVGIMFGASIMATIGFLYARAEEKARRDQAQKPKPTKH
jgi:hypothetical protein